MIVFDASGSMAGNLNQGIATTIPRIDEVRGALGTVLPRVTRVRRVGLITYGPGPYAQCNVQLNLKPTENAAGLIMQEVNALSPGRQDAAHRRGEERRGGARLPPQARPDRRAH